MNTDKEGLKSLTIRIPEELHKALKIYSVEHARSMAEVVERLIKAFLKSSDPERIFKLDLE